MRAMWTTNSVAETSGGRQSCSGMYPTRSRMSAPLVATSRPSTSARPSEAGDRPSRILIKVDSGSIGTDEPRHTGSDVHGEPVKRGHPGNRLLRLSVAITVTSTKVVTRATPVVTPQSCPHVRLQTYGSLRDALLEGYVESPSHLSTGRDHTY